MSTHSRSFRTWALLLGTVLTFTLAQAADKEPAEARALQERMRALETEAQPPERIRQAHGILGRHRLSSLQVKAIAARLPDDAARFDFAISAYPRTIDPENFYEVYDAFHSLSKVMRLHDHVRQHRPPGPIVVVEPVPVVTQEALESILGSLRRESFDDTRLQVARQIIGGSQRRFLSRQIQQILRCFDFENNRLELARFAYDHVADPEMYFLVNDVFDFKNSRDNLSRYIQSRPKAPPAAPHAP